MRLSGIKQTLPQLPAVNFKLPDGSYVPEHFHITGAGLFTKHFIDFGILPKQIPTNASAGCSPESRCC